MRIATLLAALIAATSVLAVACGDKAPSSGTGERIAPTNPAGLSPEAVLEYDGRQYAPVALRTDSPTDEFESLGQGTLTIDGDTREVEVFTEAGVNEKTYVYTVESNARSGGSEQELRITWAPLEDTNPNPSPEQPR